MSYEKQTWVPYDETLSEEENIKRGAVVTAPKLNKMETGISDAHTDLKKHEDDDKNPHKVTAKQTGALSSVESEELLLSFLGGKTIELKVNADFNNKISGSSVENSNIVRYTGSSGMPAPSASMTEMTQSQYGKLIALDNNFDTLGTSVNGNRFLTMISWDILEIVTRKYPELKGITVEELKKIVTRLSPSVWTKGSGPLGAKVSFSSWDSSQKWNAPLTNTTSDIAKIEHVWNGIATMNRVIQDDGFTYMSVYAEPSNGAIASSTSTDYTSIEITLNVSLNDIKNIVTTDTLKQLLRGGSIVESTASDFKSKIAGSNVENPNAIKTAATSTLSMPNQFVYEASASGYTSVDTLDNQLLSYSSSGKDAIRQVLISWNILEIAIRKYPELKGITVAQLKLLVKKMKVRIWAKGAGPNGNRVNSGYFNNVTSSWSVWKTSTIDQITELVLETSNMIYIDSDGIAYTNVHAEPSNGIIASSASIDYAAIELTLDLSLANLFIPRSEFNKLEIRVTKLEAAIVALGGSI